MSKIKRTMTWCRRLSVLLSIVAIASYNAGRADAIFVTNGLQKFYQCYDNMGGFISACNDFDAGCRNYCATLDPSERAGCISTCDYNQRGCGTDATIYFGNCLNENAFTFEPEMCPSAPEKASVCEAEFASCEAAAESIENQQDAMALISQCMDTRNSCLQMSGSWDCY